MKKIFIMALLAALFTQVSCNSRAVEVKQTPVKLILDTDIGPDFDDVGAMALLHTLADSAQVEILATLSCNHHELVVPVIRIMNNYYGRSAIPVGEPKSEGGANLTSDHKVKWPAFLTQKYVLPENEAGKPIADAVKIYRKVLSKSESQSVTICTIGFLTNLRDLLISGPDEYSPLTGKELVKEKVKLLVSMAGRFPSGREYNVYKDAPAGQYAINEWPTEIIFSGWEIGSKILTGKETMNMEVDNSPVKDVFEICLKERDFNGRMSWDQTAVLVAVKGAKPYFNVEKGICRVTEDGSNTWEAKESGMHERLIPALDSIKMATIIESYMMHQPFKR